MENKLTISQLLRIIDKHNKEHNVTQQFSGPNALRCVIVYSQSNFRENYSLESRSYMFTSDNKKFLPNMCGTSLYGTSLDGADQNVRLDWYDWKVDYCYVV